MTQELLHKYFKGNATRKEERQILEWLEASKENRKLFQKERMFYDIALVSDHRKTRAQMRREKKTRLRHALKWSLRAASILAVALSCGILYAEYHYNKTTSLQTVTAPAGQRAQVVLADGTKVWLNSGSTLSYAPNFARHGRDVELDGEAYFEVTPNKELPFRVLTETNRVHAVGTRFNICAYTGSNEFETTLVEGIVDVYSKDNPRPLTRLDKKQLYRTHNGKSQKTTLPSYDYLKWREGIYSFDNQPLSRICSKLALYYKVNIDLRNPALAAHRYTATFTDRDNIGHILSTLQQQHPFSYHLNAQQDSIRIE